MLWPPALPFMNCDLQFRAAPPIVEGVVLGRCWCAALRSFKGGCTAVPTWMVVEDEPDIYELLLAMFELWGIEGVAFVDGAESVSWIEDVDQGRVRGELPVLAIIDIRLPDTEIEGPQVAARLRLSPKLKNIPIVLITAYRLSVEQEADVMLESGADDLLYKPLPNMLELRAKLNEIMAQRQSAADSEEPELPTEDETSDQAEDELEHEPEQQVAAPAKTAKKNETDHSADSGQGTSSAPADPA